jgi:restriction system protein
MRDAPPKIAEHAAVPPFNALMWPTLLALKSLGGSGTNKEILGKIVELVGLSKAATLALHSDLQRTKLEYNFVWAKTYLKKIGALENPSRGRWSITSKGASFTEAEVRSITSTPIP